MIGNILHYFPSKHINAQRQEHQQAPLRNNLEVNERLVKSSSISSIFLMHFAILVEGQV